MSAQPTTCHSPRKTNNNTVGYRSKFCQSFCTRYWVESLPQKTKIIEITYTHSHISQWKLIQDQLVNGHLTFKLGNKCFPDNFIVLKYLWERFNFRTQLAIQLQNWLQLGHVNGYQYITYNKKCLYTSMPSTDTKPTIYNTGAFYLKLRSVSVIIVQIPSELTHNTSMHSIPAMILLQVLFLSAVDHKINHKYPKSLSIPTLNTIYDRVHILRAAMFSMLNPIVI